MFLGSSEWLGWPGDLAWFFEGIKKTPSPGGFFLGETTRSLMNQSALRNVMCHGFSFPGETIDASKILPGGKISEVVVTRFHIVDIMRCCHLYLHILHIHIWHIYKYEYISIRVYACIYRQICEYIHFYGCIYVFCMHLHRNWSLHIYI